MDTCGERRVARPTVEAVWALLADVADWRVMADLFQENVCAVPESGLEGLSENRIERLIENVAGLKEGD